MKASKDTARPPQANGSAPTQRSAQQSRTYRSASSRPVAAIAWAAVAGTLCWLAASGESGAALHAAPWLVLVSWLVYVAQCRPCLRADSDGFEVINGLRSFRIPFDTIEDIEVRYAVAVRAGGKKYVSWGAPTPPGSFESGFQHVSDLKSRPFSILPGNERISHQPAVATGRDQIAKAWQDAGTAGLRPSAGTVTATWNLPMIAVGTLALLWVIAAALTSLP
ncbi:hypothetical protein [Arthrobacter oryzae]|uniref:PH (Pleckstrin Homology) domain-containing protein n=1 Tax=Arthrobacter oryzae TaxID=409290 RepID=A0A495FLU4_9MICC|nr:hypothetical protein [Arthrobacter oryzae]RKR29952.1 hypothetical protein C8D78_0270 [Arthrobacter oryzae]